MSNFIRNVSIITYYNTRIATRNSNHRRSDNNTDSKTKKAVYNNTWFATHNFTNDTLWRSINKVLDDVK